MSRYLVVAHQTAASERLINRLRALASGDTHATFSLLVPATRIDHLLTWTAGESREAARRSADAGRAAMEAAGLRVARAAVGDSLPLQAIDDELRERGPYDAIVISTLPPRISRWFRMDIHARAERRFGLPVISVIAGPAEVPVA